MKQYKYPLFSVFFVVLFKMLFLLTHHIQEDAFITWRVAQNLMDYGVIGFNGNTKISASTTHLYVFISYFFNLLFGKENFIYPLLIFNSVLFTIGSFFLSKLVLKDPLQQSIFIILFGLLPPAIKISILGMEYGVLFFLEMGLLYLGFYKQKKWALILFPILILFTRIDTVIFLGIVFIVDTIKNKKLRWAYFFGCIAGVLILLSFNWFYFHEIINNTILAKKLAYEKVFSFGEKVSAFIANYGNFWGMLKVPGTTNPVTIFILLIEVIAFTLLMRKKNGRIFFLIIIFLYGWVKQIIFLSQRSYFDWYYWIPQILLFVPVLLYVLEKEKRKYLWLTSLILVFILPLMAFQTIHSIATGNGEWNYRRSIGLFLDSYEKDKNQWIFLEPAGYVPYFSHLKAIDEVGLVDKEVQTEIIKDRKNYWLNTVKHRKPKYLLSYKNLYLSADSSYYKANYAELKSFRIRDHLQGSNAILDKIYKLKPSGRDYILYLRKNTR
ncbi:hypothetical protein [Epilithonimonas sp. UC225_85]|uniref:hypothetical protein n=1 Tax=Epilithonimonas sp. UC225_85 TaxID=3350167 RepID=UPI0036D3DDC1